MSPRRTQTSEIGYWSEIKLDIIREYAAAYSRILSARRDPRLTHVYIDAFAGSGVHMARGTHNLVWGSPVNALRLSPPFKEYHFIDLDRGSIANLKLMVETQDKPHYDPASIHFYNADCNRVLVDKVFPRIRFEDYRRGLCLLDPYGLHLHWNVVEAAGLMRSLEIFLNFPIMDMNRNVLRRDRSRVAPAQERRLTQFWGDDSWREAAFSTAGNLFGYEEKEKNDALVEAFRARLSTIAGFKHVSEAMPMCNTKGAVVYYLLFASQKPVAAKIVGEIFAKYHGRRS